MNPSEETADQRMDRVIAELRSLGYSPEQMQFMSDIASDALAVLNRDLIKRLIADGRWVAQFSDKEPFRKLMSSVVFFMLHKAELLAHYQPPEPKS